MTGRRFQLRAWPKSGRIAVGPFQDWLVEVRRPNGPPVLDAAFQISGGMKAHGHGLPSAPEVRRSLGDGIYLLEGLKFSMAGDWTLIFRIQSGSETDQVELEIPVHLAP